MKILKRILIVALNICGFIIELTAIHDPSVFGEKGQFVMAVFFLIHCILVDLWITVNSSNSY